MFCWLTSILNTFFCSSFFLSIFFSSSGSLLQLLPTPFLLLTFSFHELPSPAYFFSFYLPSFFLTLSLSLFIFSFCPLCLSSTSFSYFDSFFAFYSSVFQTFFIVTFCLLLLPYGISVTTLIFGFFLSLHFAVFLYSFVY